MAFLVGFVAPVDKKNDVVPEFFGAVPSHQLWNDSTMDGPICDHQSDREEMSNSQRLAAVRRTIDRWFENRHPDADLEIRDSVLIRDGYYAGRKFQFGDYTAAWFIEEDESRFKTLRASVAAAHRRRNRQGQRVANEGRRSGPCRA